MKFTNGSKKLLELLMDFKYLDVVVPSGVSNNALLSLYKGVTKAIQNTKSVRYNTRSTQLRTLPKKPSNANSKSFPNAIQSHVNSEIKNEYIYEFSLGIRIYKVYFYSETPIQQSSLSAHITRITSWLIFLNSVSSNHCSRELDIYIYLTSLEKRLPTSSSTRKTTLDEMNVNTAYTSSCPSRGELVVFRKEEWFKVFVHETFHSFGLDFSGMNCGRVNRMLRELYNVKSDINAFEAYTEFWAEIINVIYCTYFSLTTKQTTRNVLDLVHIYLNIERKNSLLQLVKVLDYMSLDYRTLCDPHPSANELRKMNYAENTNVLSYYIIKCVLINDYVRFIEWCVKNNSVRSNSLSFLQFKQTETNLMAFCKYIRENYSTRKLLKNVSSAQDYYQHTIIPLLSKSSKQKQNYVAFTLRMSVCELE